MALAVAFMLMSGAGLLLFGRGIAGLYVAGRSAADLQAIGLAVVFLRIAAAFQVFDGLQVIAAFSLRGLKDARAPMLLAGASYWLVGAPCCVWLGLGLGWRGVGVWTGLAVGLAVAALTLCSRFLLLTRRPAVQKP
jgi:MATE family multidrug resistance protein